MRRRVEAPHSTADASAADYLIHPGGHFIRFIAVSGGDMPATCEHIQAIKTVRHATRRECAECVKIGSQWVHLRTCQECGVTLCCDNSPNQHATKHAHATGHPVIASGEQHERWLYCYPDDAF